MLEATPRGIIVSSVIFDTHKILKSILFILQRAKAIFGSVRTAQTYACRMLTSESDVVGCCRMSSDVLSDVLSDVQMFMIHSCISGSSGFLHGLQSLPERVMTSRPFDYLKTERGQYQHGMLDNIECWLSLPASTRVLSALNTELL